MKATSISAEGSVKGKNEGRKRTLRSSLLEEAAQEVGDHALQVGEADPRRPTGLRPDGTSANGWRRNRRDRPGPGDDADFRHLLQMAVAGDVGLHVAGLDRAGVGAQQTPSATWPSVVLAGRRCRASNAPDGLPACSGR